MPSQYRLFSICTLLIVLLTPWFHHDHNSRGLNGLAAAAKKDEDEPYPLYNQIPMHEILQNSLYVTLTQFGEIIVTYTGKGADLKPDDYVTHADGIKVLTGSVQEFLESGLREAVVPVVDDSDVKYGGKRLLGFVMIQSVIPRKIFTRRGEIEFDMEEGGPAPVLAMGDLIVAPDGIRKASGEDYVPPPQGGGQCITARDCFFYNGTCPDGHCKCPENRTGSFCQLDRVDKVGVADIIERQKLGGNRKIQRQEAPPPNPNLPRPVAEQDLTVNIKPAPKLASVQVDAGASPDASKPKQTPETSGSKASSNVGGDQNQQQRTQREREEPKVEKLTGSTGQESQSKQSKADGAADESGHDDEEMKPIPMTPKSKDKAVKVKPGAKKKPKTGAGKKGSKDDGSGTGDDAGSADGAEGDSAAPAKPAAKKEKKKSTVPTEEELYGVNGMYPAPYTAGKVPVDMVQARNKMRQSGASFRYSIRFRSGPIGLSFDNVIPNATVVERVMQGMQAQLSDIIEGDKLIAIDHHNVSDMPARLTQKILSSSPWPMVLTFEAKLIEVNAEQKKAEAARRRTFNMTIIYPPTLTGEYEVRLADWGPNVDIYHEEACPVYSLRPAPDLFGCSNIDADTYSVPPHIHDIIANGGKPSADVEERSPMMTMLVHEGIRERIPIKAKSMGIAKRGICTFVTRAANFAKGGSNMGIVVNTDDQIVEMPAGRENTTAATVPTGIIRLSDGELMLISNAKSEVLATVSDPKYGISPICTRLINLADDLIDRWSHSVPHVPVNSVIQSKSNNNKLRGDIDEGGRVAISGQNGWAFFDYHLALFGPQEVPLGPHRLQMAVPPHGCDANEYSVRINNTVVAILRGGGCSFGVKVLNAQKLGAKAVMIVNTDDMKTMRLNALPDEVPLIKIPCIMVSRRIQFYLEEQLRYFHPIDQHIVSIQPTGVFGEYEARNQLKLPQRLDL